MRKETNKNRKGFETECISSDERFKYVKSSQMGHWNVLSRTRCTGHGNDFQLIPMVWMESQHSIGWSGVN